MFNFTAKAQVAINTDGALPHSSAMLEISSTNRGLLLPRVTSTNNITSPTNGLLVFQTGGTPGLYFYSGSWMQLSSGGSGVTSITGSAPISATPTTGAVTISMPAASGSTNGYLKATDWVTFNNKLSGTKGNLTETTSSVLTINGGTGAILGSGVTIAVKQAGSSQNGYLTSVDWNLFNDKISSQWSNDGNNNIYYSDASGGNVGIGINWTPSHRLEVVNAVDDFVASFKNTNNTNSSNGILVQAGNSVHNTGSSFINFWDPDQSSVGAIQYDGSGALIYSSVSDSSLKENIIPTHLNLHQLLEIKVRDFNWKKDPAKKTNSGFVAQELYKVYPDAVSVPLKASDKWMVSKESLIPLLVKSIQDQQEIIKSQQDQINALEERLRLIELKLGK